MKLLQLNVWNGRLDKQIPELFVNEKADILCLQEAISLEGEASLFITLEEMQAAAGLEYVLTAPVFSFNFMHRLANFSNCILSRLPIQKSEVIFTNNEFTDNFDFVLGRANMRNFAHAEIDIGGVSSHFLTHHGYHIPDHKKGDENTLRQMKFLGEYIDSLNGPVILTGDFNLAPHSKSLEHINRRLRNLSMEYNLTTTRTHLTNKREVCDYIFINDKIKVNNFYASDFVASDHKALILDFQV